MSKFIKELSDEEFEEISPMLSYAGGARASVENMEIIGVITRAKMGAKFFIKKENYPFKNPVGVQYIVQHGKYASDYDYNVSIRTLKDRSGWVLLKMPRKQ